MKIKEMLGKTIAADVSTDTLISANHLTPPEWTVYYKKVDFGTFETLDLAYQRLTKLIELDGTLNENEE